MAAYEIIHALCALSGLTCLMIGILSLERHLKSLF